MESLRGMSGNNSGIIAWVSSFIEPSQDPASAANSLHLTIEPTLANEGALWFPDLLAGDSTGVLPCLLTASIVGNAVIGWKVHPWKEISLLPTQEMYKKLFSHGLRSFVIALACYVGSYQCGYAADLGTGQQGVFTGEIQLVCTEIHRLREAR
ncbi:unnamed protein product [Penicillium glandicola]